MLHSYLNFVLRSFPNVWFAFTLLLVYATWQRLVNSPKLARVAVIAMFLCGLAEWAMLTLLPRLNLSYGPTGIAWFLMLCGRILLFLAFALPLTLLMRLRPATFVPGLALGALVAWGIANLALSAVEFYSLYIEPFDLRTTTLRLSGPAFFPDRSLRVVQLTDIHVERITQREREILTRVNALQPDLIVLTGDYVNIDYLTDPLAIQETRTFLSQLHAPYGVYAVSGSTAVDIPETMAKLFADLQITVLNDQAQTLKIGEGVLYLMGVSDLDDGRRDRAALSELMKSSPLGAYSLLLYHTPDLIEAAAEDDVDLYLAGHTHGGQIRMPFIGPLITFSKYERKYASGQHALGPTTLYTSRGLGMEGLNLPRARFLCPPEIVVIEIGRPGPGTNPGAGSS